MEWENNQENQQQHQENQNQRENRNGNNMSNVNGNNGNGGMLYVKVMTDEQLETLRKQIAVYATICEQLVEMHKTLSAQQDLAGLNLFLYKVAVAVRYDAATEAAAPTCLFLYYYYDFPYSRRMFPSLRFLSLIFSIFIYFLLTNFI